VLDGGVVKLAGPGKDLLEDPEVGRLYLGLGSTAA
jgi:hypothetical protein